MMKSAMIVCLGLVALLAPAWAMPPSPDLLDRMANGTAAQSYYLAHEADIRALGVESPTKVQLICDLASRHLDEDFNILAILVDFSDHVSTAPSNSFDNLLYGTQTGSVRNYYEQVTFGNVTLVTVNLPSEIGWRRMPQTYSYYVNGQQGFGSYPHNAQKLAEDAVTAAASVVNFAPYDNDGDGVVDALFIIHSGSGAELTGSNNDIWSHKWGLHTPQIHNGVTISTYSMEPEYWYSAGDMTCGVYCHELGHDAFGLPDLYDTGYNSEGIGNWSLMAGGSWNGSLGNSPAQPDAWCRIAMGAAQPTILTANQYGASIPSVESSGTIFRLWTNGTGGSQYFLVENRQRTGYDAALPNAGLLIYHIDDSQSSNNNPWYPGHTSSGHYHVAVVQADNLWQLEENINRGNAGDPYPGSVNNTTFDDTSSPNSRAYNGTVTNVAVRNIGPSAATMTADLLINTAPPLLTAPTVVVSLDDAGNVHLNWPSTNAPYYRIYTASTSRGPFTTVLGSTVDTSYIDTAATDIRFYQVTSSSTP
jgi:immune inhibitor A